MPTDLTPIAFTGPGGYSNSPYTPGFSPVDPSIANAVSVTNINLATLLGYQPNQVRDTWIAMGQAEVENTSRVYIRNSVFRLVQPTPTTALNGCIFFCDADVTVPSTFMWENMQLSNPVTGDIMDTTTSIVDPHIHLVLTQAQFQAITVDYDPTFIPFQEPNSKSLVTISDDDLNMILIDLGVPFINLEELEFTRDEITNYMILPAMREFFKFYPIITVGYYPLADNNFQIAIPNWAFTAGRAYINPGYPLSNVQGNPLARYFDEVLMSISPRGAFSTPNLNSSRRQGFVDTQSYATYILERAARQGIINYGTRTRIRIFIQQGYLKGYSTKRGILEVEWNSMSNDWGNIPFNRQTEVRDLAKAYVLRAFGMLRSQAKSDVPGTLDYTSFIERSKELEEFIITTWRESTKATLVRV